MYVTNNDAVAIAKLYRGYVQEKDQFKTLVEKAQDNPEINKLYGAPHIYMWNSQLLTERNIRWQVMKKKLSDPLWAWLEELLKDEAEALKSVRQEAKKGPLNAYHKQVIVKALNRVLKLEKLYHRDRFPSVDAPLQKTIAAGIEKLSEQQLYTFNKNLLKYVLQDAVDAPAEWGQDHSSLVTDMHQTGMTKAWIGFPDWADGLMNPNLVEKAAKLGYLIGPYDDYHPIQKEEDKAWRTTYFPDSTLYEQATITNKQGKKLAGFLNRGRKLNPTLSLSSVKQRVNGILQDGIPFNSWFVDCDAAGEVHDDYSPAHVTTQDQDRDARLTRMDYIAKEKKMVVGSETGNDFASKVIAFAHGLETPVIKWVTKICEQIKTARIL